MIARPVRRLFTRLRRDERGVTMYLVLGLMVISSLLMAGVLTATSTDASLSRRDLDAKKAVYAAQAGIAAYLQALNANPNYWTTCPTSTGYSSGQTVAVPNSTVNDESYSFTPLPAPGYSACSSSDPVTTMVTSQGTFRVQFNGFSGVSDTSTEPVVRSYVVTFKHESFLNYVYFTQYEQVNPTLDSQSSNGQQPSECVNQTVAQIITAQAGGNDTPCQLINWVTGDDVAGPMFSDDYLYICGQPRFGTTPSDTVYTLGIKDDTGNGCNNNTPYVNTPPAAVSGEGTLQTTFNPLTIPQSNDTLEAIAMKNTPASVYYGVTYIKLGTNGYTVTNPYAGLVDVSKSYPSNGVLYVDQSPSGTCTAAYAPSGEDYTEYDSGGGGAGCGTVFVSGTYGQSVTIASAQDVVVDGNLISGASNALLGLVPQDWARVYHQVMSGGTSASCSGTNNGASTNGGTATEPTAINSNGSISGSLQSPTIDAAILTTGDSWIVDNFNCGGSLGTLTVDGAIAQYYRGTVGTTNGNGYIKNYEYDTRLSAESPPFFLSPVNPAWSIQSESSCSSIGHLTSTSSSATYTKTCY